MPSLDNPTFYERSRGMAPGRFDQFFKFISADEAVESDGDVESPFGYVQLVKLDAELIDLITNVEWPFDEDSIPSRLFDVGWYITRLDNNGLIWAMWYGDLDSTYVEEQARADYAEFEKAYSEWNTEDDDEDEEDNPDYIEREGEPNDVCLARAVLRIQHELDEVPASIEGTLTEAVEYAYEVLNARDLVKYHWSIYGFRTACGKSLDTSRWLTRTPQMVTCKSCRKSRAMR